MTVAIALLVSLGFGMLAWLALLGRPRTRSGWLACMGAGYLLGALLTGVLLGLAAGLPLSRWSQTLLPAAAITIPLAMAMLAAVWRWRAPPPPDTAVIGLRPPEHGWLWLLGLLLLVHAIVLTGQALALPTLAWDAWNSWLAKPRAWIGADALLSTVDFGPWWAAPGETLQVTAGVYPESVPRFVAWIAAAAGGWHEPSVHLAWPLLWLALGAMLFGYLRLAGAAGWLAGGAAFAVLSLPLVSAHVALAGYTDLWVAAALLLACMHLERAWRLRSLGDVVLAVLATALLPMVKVEGGVWLLCVLAGAALAALPRRLLYIGLLAVVLVVVGGLALGGIPIPLPGSGVAHLQWGAIDVPGKGLLQLYWRPVGDAVLQSLLFLPNWHLLWLLLPLAAFLGRSGLRRPTLRPLSFALALAYTFVFVLFFFTDASAWAESLTSVNRVLLQIVPATVFWVSLLYVRPPAPRGRWA